MTSSRKDPTDSRTAADAAAADAGASPESLSRQVPPSLSEPPPSPESPSPREAGAGGEGALGASVTEAESSGESEGPAAKPEAAGKKPTSGPPPKDRLGWIDRFDTFGIPARIAILVLVLALAPSIIALVLRGFGVPGIWTASAIFLQPFAHTLIEWTGAIVALVTGLFAYARWRLGAESELEVLAIAGTMPVVAALDMVHALVPFMVSEGRTDYVLAFTWNASRWFLAAILVAGLWLAWSTAGRSLELRWPGPVLAVLACAAFLVLGGIAERDPGMVELAEGARPWELGPLLLFLVAGCTWAPALTRLRGSGITRGLLLAFVPLITSQLEMALGSLVLGHWSKLLAYGVILGGAVADYGAAQRSRWSAGEELENAEQELRSKTEELERIDIQRMLQEEKRRAAEESLRMLAKAVETMSLGVTITDMDGRIIYVNPADARVHGYTVEELMGQDSRIYAGGGAHKRSEEAIEPWARERINSTKSGETFPVRLVSDRVRDDAGAPVATVTICEDIRERIRIRAALERRDRVLEAVAFAAGRFLSDAPWEESVGDVLRRLGEATGVDQVYLDLVNDAYPFGIDEVTYAWPSEEEVGTGEEASSGTEPARPHRLQLPERWEVALRAGETLCGRVPDLPAIEQQQLVLRGVSSFALVPLFVESQWQGYLCLEAESIDREWSHAELEALKTASRTFGASIERRQDEEALAASEAKYRDLLEGANDLVQSVSPDGRFQFVNRAWKQTLGYSDEEVGDLTIWDVVRPAPSESRDDVLQSMLVADGQARIEATFVSRTQEEITVEGVVTCRYEDGLPVAAQGIFRDITEREQLDRMKQDFLSTVSHELRTPLTSIIASLGLLESGRLADKPERHSELLSVAHRNSIRLLKLINNLLDLQKLAARKMSFRRDVLTVSSLLDEAIGSIQAYADQGRVRLLMIDVPESLTLLGDRDRLIQVLNNLLSNAIKFSSAGEEVTVGAYEQQDRVVLSVSDQGPGIPEEFLSRLFDQFTQADATQTRSAGGSGLGLSIARGLVEGMGGQIRVDTVIDRGTTFFVELPAPSGQDPSHGSSTRLPDSVH